MIPELNPEFLQHMREFNFDMTKSICTFFIFVTMLFLIKILKE